MTQHFGRIPAGFLCGALLLGTAGLLCGCDKTDADVSSLPPHEVVGQLALPEGITLPVPSDFTVTSSDAYAEYYVKDDASIILTEEPLTADYNTPEKYAARAAAQYRAATESFTLLEEAPCEIGGTTGRTMEFCYTISIGSTPFSLHCLAGYVLTADTAYIITCKADAEHFSQYADAFRETISGAKPK